ncbi:MAG: hypothetical protein MR328_03190 [Firmicutes bacterium]|nr:hypothetical protein [Bacillota bacterium]
MGDKSNVFVIMPFQDEFFEVYEMLKIELSEKYEFTNAGDEGNQQNILRDIIEPIYKADVAITCQTPAKRVAWYRHWRFTASQTK